MAFPTEYEPLKKSHRIHLIATCKGASGGSDAEWIWSCEKGESPSLYTSRLSYVPNILNRNGNAINQWRAEVSSTGGLYAVDLDFHTALVRKPETLVKKSSPPTEGSDLSEWAKILAGKSGDSESSWQVTRYLSEDFASFYTDIPSIASRLIQRAGFDLFSVKVTHHGGNQYSFSCKVPSSRVRNPVALVRPAS
jgi:hypothetical protein